MTTTIITGHWLAVRDADPRAFGLYILERLAGK